MLAQLTYHSFHGVLFHHHSISFYRTSLVAFIVADIDTPPVQSLGEIRMSDYYLALLKNTVYDDMFLQAKRDPADSQYKLLAKSDKIVRFSGDTHKYIEKMVTGKNEARKSILFWSLAAARFNKHYPCRLGYIKSAPRNAIQNVGMIFKKNWPYKNLINYHLLKMSETGMLDRLLDPYENAKKKSCPNEVKIRSTLKQTKPIGSDKTIFLYSILCLGFIVAFIFLFLEFVYQNLCKKSRI